MDKFETLKKYFESVGRVAVAYSSGVDSTFLLKTAHDVLGDGVIAITAKSHSFPGREYEESVAFCRKEGIRQIVFDSEELNIPGFKENPENRCYICKRGIFSKISEIAASQGIDIVCEGSNMDDLGDYRPGLKAVSELGIQSPLRMCGLFKSEIREFSKMLGLETWDKPSFACLASRFPYGEMISAEKLSMVEQAESYLLANGFVQERVRIHSSGDGTNAGFMARIEVFPEAFPLIISLREQLVEEFKKIGFNYVALDLQGFRSGSMNEILKSNNES